MGWNLKAWRRRRVLERKPLPDALWQRVVARLPLLEGLTADELERLRQWVILFLDDKDIHAAAGFAVTEEMRVAIAAQACLLILNLDMDYYRGWVEVIVYPDEFVPEREYMDDAGVVHMVREPFAGESWLAGPVLLSWADVECAGEEPGYNVVIHEFAHKLDMLNGEPNGFPPLHADMSRAAWSEAFGSAYKDFCARVEAGEDTLIDPYGAESPAEFFAVMTEAFFETPDAVQESYPEVYRQLCAFYRQDPAVRVERDQ